jgi:hypothetical protein
VSNEDFRRELNNVFDGVSGSPSSNLPDRVRSAVAHAPDERAPYWIAGVAAVVIATLVVGTLYFVGPFKPPSLAGGVHTTPSPSPVSSPTSQSSPTPTPSGQPFICAAESIHNQGAPPPPLVYVSALRTGAHPGYDRLTIEFANGMPADMKVSVQAGTRFVLSPSGMPTTLKGQNGILIVIDGSDLHTSYSGPIDIVTGDKGLAEVRRVEDFEGTVQLGLGVNGPACCRTTLLTNPNRLVIDIQTG